MYVKFLHHLLQSLSDGKLTVEEVLEFINIVFDFPRGESKSV